LLRARHAHLPFFDGFSDAATRACIALAQALTQICNMIFYNKRHTGRLASLWLRDLVAWMGRDARFGVASWLGGVAGSRIGRPGFGAGDAA